MEKNISTFIGCDNDYNDSRIAIFGAPFDSTTSFRPGTRFAGRAMREESFGIETYSPYQDKDLEDAKIFDCGDLELCFGDCERALTQISEMVSKILDDNKIPGMIGGEHLVTLGSVREVVKRYPELHIIHFDAHTDLRDEYLGQKLSHACVMRRVWELIGDNRIFQFGIRSGDRSEFIWGSEHVFTQKFSFGNLEKVTERLRDKPIYFTLDFDVLDPSVFPGTGTPEAGGVTFNELLSAILKLNGLNIVGFDVNELSPHYDQSGASTAAACKALREILLMLSATQKPDSL